MADYRQAITSRSTVNMPPGDNGDKYKLGELTGRLAAIDTKCDMILKTFGDHAESDDRQFDAIRKVIEDVKTEQTRMRLALARWSGVAAAIGAIVGVIAKIAWPHG